MEQFALKECERRDEEIFKEADRVRRRLEEEEKMKQSISDIKTKEKLMRLPFPLSSTPFSTVTSPLPSAGLIASTPVSMATTGSMATTSTMATTGSMATTSTMATTGSMAAKIGASRETAIVSNGVHPSPSDIVKPMNRINLSDFESSNSSPFDDALLRAIDDRQELNHIFNHHNHRQDK